MGERLINPLLNIQKGKTYKKMIFINPYRFGSKEPFTFTILTSATSAGSSTSTQFKLPLISSGAINIDVDWGDGNTNNITSYYQSETTHTYTTAGTYTIKMSGTIRGFRFNNSGDRLKIKNISKWGDMNITHDCTFYSCSNLTCTATDFPVISTTSLSYTFTNCNLFNGAIGNWNISGVTNLSFMFKECYAFNQPLNSWNVSNVTTMEQTFYTCIKFNQPLNSWNVSSVTTMALMFFRANAFNQPLNSWNVSNVTTMDRMFLQCFAFNQDIGDWNISNVSNFIDFMSGKAAGDYSTINLNSIYNKWSLLSVKANININFGTIKYTSAASSGKAILNSSPNNWIIQDGGI